MSIPRPKRTGDLGQDEFFEFVYQKLLAGFMFKQTRTAANYTIQKNDFYIGITDTTIARTIILPPLASVPKNVTFIIKDESGGAGANNITVDGDSAETIDGAATKAINSNYGLLRITRSETAWFTW